MVGLAALGPPYPYLLRRDLDVAVGHRAVVALEHEGAGGEFAAAPGTAGLLLHFHVFVDQLVVERDLDEPGVLHLLVALELGGLEPFQI